MIELNLYNICSVNLKINIERYFEIFYSQKRSGNLSNSHKDNDLSIN